MNMTPLSLTSFAYTRNLQVGKVLNNHFSGENSHTFRFYTVVLQVLKKKQISSESYAANEHCEEQSSTSRFVPLFLYDYPKRSYHRNIISLSFEARFAMQRRTIDQTKAQMN